MNAIIIEQNRDEIKLASEVNQSAAINRIRLARAKVASQVVDDGPTESITVNFNFKSKPLTAPANILRLEIAFDMAGVEEEKKPDGKKLGTVVLVECAYEVDYVLRDGFEITPDHVKAFKDGNAIFNAWPYFREYLQNNLERMGLPSLTAPFLRLQPKPTARKREKHAPKIERTVPGQRRQ